jgi:hypothetical protein
LPSAEELAAAETRRIEERERIDEDHKRKKEERDRQFVIKRPTKVRKGLAFLRLCQRTPGAERQKLTGTCVYLMWCPSLEAYKIGHTERLGGRIEAHRRKLDPRIELHIAYYTPLTKRKLEGVVLRHFHYFRVREDLGEELFNLPQKEIDEFEATVKAIERHLLAIEIMRLKAALLKFEADCPEVEDGRTRHREKNGRRNRTHRE